MSFRLTETFHTVTHWGASVWVSEWSEAISSWADMTDGGMFCKWGGGGHLALIAWGIWQTHWDWNVGWPPLSLLHTPSLALQVSVLRQTVERLVGRFSNQTTEGSKWSQISQERCRSLGSLSHSITFVSEWLTFDTIRLCASHTATVCSEKFEWIFVMMNYFYLSFNLFPSCNISP